jgi:hypothetical protein
VGTDTAGKGYVFFGGTVLTGLPDVTVEGVGVDQHLGSVTAVGGDYNGDGYDDVVFGAAGDSGRSVAARVYVWFGGAEPDGLIDHVIVPAGVTTSGLFLGLLSGFDATSEAEVLVGTPGDSVVLPHDGRVVMFLGSSTPRSDPDSEFVGALRDGYFGMAIGDSRDINGDGYGDAVIGAPGVGAPPTTPGRVYAYWGGTSTDAAVDLVLEQTVYGGFASVLP